MLEPPCYHHSAILLALGPPAFCFISYVFSFRIRKKETNKHEAKRNKIRRRTKKTKHESSKAKNIKQGKEITKTLSDSPSSGIIRFLFRTKRGEKNDLFAQSAENIVLSLTISCAVGCQTHGTQDLGQRVEQMWPNYFVCSWLPDTRYTGPRLARRAEVAGRRRKEEEDEGGRDKTKI